MHLFVQFARLSDQTEGVLRGLDGATLRWAMQTVSHSQLRLSVHDLIRSGDVTFKGVVFMETPTVMHDVRVRLGTDEDLARVREFVEPVGARVERGDVVTITCREGRGWICARGLILDWREGREGEQLDGDQPPLWNGGPPLHALGGFDRPR
jgi:hypothetical protein